MYRTIEQPLGVGRPTEGTVTVDLGRAADPDWVARNVAAIQRIMPEGSVFKPRPTPGVSYVADPDMVSGTLIGMIPTDNNTRQNALEGFVETLADGNNDPTLIDELEDCAVFSIDAGGRARRRNTKVYVVRMKIRDMALRNTAGLFLMNEEDAECRQGLSLPVKKTSSNTDKLPSRELKLGTAFGIIDIASFRVALKDTIERKVDLMPVGPLTRTYE